MVNVGPGIGVRPRISLWRSLAWKFAFQLLGTSDDVNSIRLRVAMKRVVTVLLVTILTAAGFFYTRSISAADTDFLIYFENSTLALKSQTIERVTYLPLLEIVRHLGLPYTDATNVMTFSIQGQNSRLALTTGSAFISVSDQPILLQNPIRRDGDQWLVPLDFLSQGLSKVAGLEFRYKPGNHRIFTGKVTAAELAMNAQSLGTTTRLTLRLGSAVDVELDKDASQRRAVLMLRGKPIDPARERLDYKDALVQSVAFDDSGGQPRLVIAYTDEVRDIRVTAGEENRVYFVDFIHEVVSEASPVTAPSTPQPLAAAAAAARGNGIVRPNGLRVIVIDAGHGGIDNGATNASTLEKDLTLALARRLRTALQSRMGATVILTRESDVKMTSEARAAVANNNQAGLFISLHIGYSPNKSAAGSSIYIMKPDFTGGTPEPAGGRLFFPWYMAYRMSLQSSQAAAAQLQKNLNQALPGWKFPIRTGPIGVLASSTMPAVAIEVGNLNNDLSVKTLSDAEFQTKLASTIAAGIEQFAVSSGGGRPQ
jgi:N-acetylmuramoyl-L-alanine amidase